MKKQLSCSVLFLALLSSICLGAADSDSQLALYQQWLDELNDIQAADAPLFNEWKQSLGLPSSAFDDFDNSALAPIESATMTSETTPKETSGSEQTSHETSDSEEYSLDCKISAADVMQPSEETDQSSDDDLFGVNAITGFTALHHAAREDNHDRVLKLIKTNGIIINQQDVLGATPLHIAARFGHKEIVKTLISIGHVDLTLTDNEGENPLETARTYNQHEAYDILRKKYRTPSPTDDSGSPSPRHRWRPPSPGNLIRAIFPPNTSA